MLFNLIFYINAEYPDKNFEPVEISKNLFCNRMPLMGGFSQGPNALSLVQDCMSKLSKNLDTALEKPELVLGSCTHSFSKYQILGAKNLEGNATVVRLMEKNGSSTVYRCVVNEIWRSDYVSRWEEMFNKSLDAFKKAQAYFSGMHFKKTKDAHTSTEDKSFSNTGTNPHCSYHYDIAKACMERSEMEKRNHIYLDETVTRGSIETLALKEKEKKELEEDIHSMSSSEEKDNIPSIRSIRFIRSTPSIPSFDLRKQQDLNIVRKICMQEQVDRTPVMIMQKDEHYDIRKNLIFSEELTIRGLLKKDHLYCFEKIGRYIVEDKWKKLLIFPRKLFSLLSEEISKRDVLKAEYDKKLFFINNFFSQSRKIIRDKAERQLLIDAEAAQREPLLQQGIASLEDLHAVAKESLNGLQEKYLLQYATLLGLLDEWNISGTGMPAPSVATTDSFFEYPLSTIDESEEIQVTA